MNNRLVRTAALVIATGFVAGLLSPVGGQTIRFCPGEDAPIAYNPVTGVYEEGSSFDPLLCAEIPCIELLHNIFEPLVSTSDDRRIEPVLATGWERLDEVTFRFTLRRGVTFHNGERFDAEAVRFSLMRASEAYSVTAWFPEIARVDIVKPFTVDVVLSEPDSLFLYRLANIGLIMPPRYIRRMGVAKFGARPVGTGAFQFVRWDAQRREVHLKAYSRYWRKGHPKIKNLVYSYMKPDQALDLLMAGKLDLIRRMNPRKTTHFMRNGTGRIVKAWLPQLVLGQFNLLKPGTPLMDSRVRQAINLAINREHLLRYGAIGNGRLLGGYTVPDDPHNAGLKPYPYDVPRARRLLEESGHASDLSLSVIVANTVPSRIENIIAVSLRRIGIDVKVERLSVPEILHQVFLHKFGVTELPSFDIVVNAMPAGTILHSGTVPMTFLYSRQPNESVLRDAELDRLFEKAIATYDPVKAAALWKKLERYVYDNQLLFIGYQEKTIFGARKNLNFTPRTLMSFWDAHYGEDSGT